MERRHRPADRDQHDGHRGAAGRAADQRALGAHGPRAEPDPRRPANPPRQLGDQDRQRRRQTRRPSRRRTARAGRARAARTRPRPAPAGTAGGRRHGARLPATRSPAARDDPAGQHPAAGVRQVNDGVGTRPSRRRESPAGTPGQEPIPLVAFLRGHGAARRDLAAPVRDGLDPVGSIRAPGQGLRDRGARTAPAARTGPTRTPW